MIYRPTLLPLISDQRVFTVEKEYVKLLYVLYAMRAVQKSISVSHDVTTGR